MRQPAVLICLSLCLAACGGGEEPVAAPSPGAKPAAAAAPATVASPPAAQAPVATAAAQAARRLLDDYLQAWNRHDGEAVAAFLAEDAVVFDALRGKPANGREEARAGVIGMYLRALPDGQWSLRGEPVVSADGFSYEWTLTGTNTGDWNGYLRGRGQKIDFKGASIVRLREGRIAYQANYFDTQVLGAQAGW